MTIPPNIAYADAAFKSSFSSTPRTHAERAGDIIDVKDYEAVGDGTVDDRLAIQKAVDTAFGGPLNQRPGGSLVPHGYTNRHLNRALFFPPGGYNLSDSIILTHVYGGKIFAGAVQVGINSAFPGGDASAPALVVNGMVETRIEGLHFHSPGAPECNIDLDWDGDWDDLPDPTRGLNHNVIMRTQIGGCKRGIRVAAGGFDGSHNTFMATIINSTSIAGIELMSSTAIGNMVIGGGCDLLNSASAGGPTVGYKSGPGQFSVIQGTSMGTNTTVDFQCDSPFPMSILGGRSEANGTGVKVTNGLVGVYGFNFNNVGFNIANVTGGRLTLQGCGSAASSTITGAAPGILYIVGCGFPAGIHSGFTGTVHET